MAPGQREWSDANTMNLLPKLRKGRQAHPATCRFVGSLHVIFGAHWDHEPRRVRSAGFRACGFGRLSSRPFLVHRTRKSGKPAGWKACATSRFMGRKDWRAGLLEQAILPAKLDRTQGIVLAIF